VHHILRCSPSSDNLLRSALSRITNFDVSQSDTQWFQAFLTIREGGLGVRRVASLALPAFLASAASTQSLQAAILHSHFSQPDHLFETYRDRWSTTFSPVPTGLFPAPPIRCFYSLTLCALQIVFTITITISRSVPQTVSLGQTGSPG